MLCHCLISYPLPSSNEAIAPDVLAHAADAGMDPDMFGEDVMAFMTGGVRKHCHHDYVPVFFYKPFSFSRCIGKLLATQTDIPVAIFSQNLYAN